jgi:hypothetical protein
VFLAAAGQRTQRVELGPAVIPIGYENPFRLAEDLALADVLSRGRLQAGFSTGMPHADLLADLVYDGDWRGYDLSYNRIGRVVDHLRGRYLGGPDTVIRSPGNIQRPRLQPHDPGLVDRIWYGGGAMVLRLLLELPGELPVALIHGTRDRLVPYDGGMASLWGFRPRGLGLSAPETAAYLAGRHGIARVGPVIEPLPSLAQRHIAITRTRYADPAHPPVELYTVGGGGHTVPGPNRAPIMLGLPVTG